ncbi:nitrogen permease regulator Npr2 [Coprinopsis cinerea okayama7|uniref:Nitrogen permease regulator Npr2 n=1 Tax=Coprinopsis cinerea (strain Okayama-7 / 130 / ATCC MYA-4618 / FGSC 9003) TaxID=240176 RepID=A8NEU2_COPC7|nr:nitrogen permease regulator Npr2 [Coprinopsis cinerea okayama7\|eukprot:XP_001833128.2 nitrogen permease regulator Npr2 [Coprinopsis cinerea okayama7\
MSGGDSFLPRIQSVFYAVFDETVGPKIVYQVPEGLIASQTQIGVASSHDQQSSTPSSPSSPSPEGSSEPQTPTVSLPSRASSSSLVSPTDLYNKRGRQFPSPSNNKRSMSSQPTLFNFSEISIIIGFPVELTGRYKRYYFRYNLCFVFERNADLSCYEPVVRKISRVLKSCEEESGFLSSPETCTQVYSILEQLYEDLNSYSETSIPIDQFNSIELKIFPFYPNPPDVKDWMVPLALINIQKRFEENWDLTMIKVCRFIDGVNHVGRIAKLADCDPRLTRQAIAHLLYYQVIMTIDIFQYSNMYTLCRSVQWLADETHVKDECGPYVVKSGTQRIPDWPDLLHLYSRLKTGKTVFEWMREYNVESLGIDVRRFITFGVIKGFLRRVHRYPMFVRQINHTPEPEPQPYSDPSSSTLMRKRAQSLQGMPPYRAGGYDAPMTTDVFSGHGFVPQQSALFQNTTGLASANPEGPPPPSATGMMSATSRARRASAAEKILEQLRNRDIQKSGSGTGVHSPRLGTSWVNYHGRDREDNHPPPSSSVNQGSIANSYTSTTTAASYSTVRYLHDSPSKPNGGGGRESRRTSLVSPTVPPPSPVLPKVTLTPSRPPRMTRSPSMHHPHVCGHGRPPPYPPQLIPLLDGDHHTDEIGVILGCGWPQLEEWLVAVGGGQGNGDLGDVVVIYR